MSNIHELKGLSPSNSNIWMKCNASKWYFKNLKNYVDTNVDKYAENGIESHNIALEQLKEIIKDNDLIEQRALSPLKIKKSDCGDKIFYATKYVDFVCENYIRDAQQCTNSFIKVETLVDCCEYINNLIGTPDVFFVCGKQLTVIDYKFGKYKVDAYQNSQLLIYALCVLSSYKEFTKEVESIKLVIYQPRIDNTPEWCISRNELLEWVNAIKRSFNSGSSRTDCNYGDHCYFCPGQKFCYEYINCSRCEDYLYDYRILKDDEIESRLNAAKRAKGLKELIEHYFETILCTHNKLHVTHPISNIHSDIQKILDEEYIKILDNYEIKKTNDLNPASIVMKKELKSICGIREYLANVTTDVIDYKSEKFLLTKINSAISFDELCAIISNNCVFEFNEKNYVMVDYDNLNNIRKYLYSIEYLHAFISKLASIKNEEIKNEEIENDKSEENIDSVDINFLCKVKKIFNISSDKTH